MVGLNFGVIWCETNLYMNTRGASFAAEMRILVTDRIDSQINEDQQKRLL